MMASAMPASSALAERDVCALRKWSSSASDFAWPEPTQVKSVPHYPALSDNVYPQPEIVGMAAGVNSRGAVNRQNRLSSAKSYNSHI